MRIETREEGSRHRWLDEFCGHLDAVIAARAARRCAPRGACGVAVLPAWAFMAPHVHVGPHGERGLLPARLEWTDSRCPAPEGTGAVITLARGERRELAWRATGLGYASPPQGLTRIAAGAHDRQEGWDVGAGILLPARAEVAVEPAPSAQRQLRALADLERSEMWALREMLHKPARRAVESACHYVSWEVSGYSHVRPVLDPIDVERAVDEMVLGTGGRADSPVSRTIERCLLPSTFLHVEPYHYVRVSLRRDAIAVVRRMIGDPHIGPKVRRVMREEDPADLDELVAIYRERYPRDRLSKERAIRAITAGSDVMSLHLPMDTTGERTVAKKEVTR